MASRCACRYSDCRLIWIRLSAKCQTCTTSFFLSILCIASPSYNLQSRPVLQVLRCWLDGSRRDYNQNNLFSPPGGRAQSRKLCPWRHTGTRRSARRSPLRHPAERNEAPCLWKEDTRCTHTHKHTQSDESGTSGAEHHCLNILNAQM